MKGNYKVYNANKGEWVNLPLNYRGDGLQLKIENGHLWSSYDGEKTWEDVGEVGAKIEPTYIHCTHKDLIDLRNSSKLIPETFYRITDYECTTTQADTRSANHPFDIIVQALDESTLSEDAQAIQHDGDEYFTDVKLEAWQLKYVIDNDTSRFAWAQDEIKESLGSWDSDAGHIKTVTSKEDDILPEKTIVINGVETPVFRTVNINNYDFSTFDIGRPGRTYSDDEFSRFKYVGTEKPSSNTVTTEGAYGYGGSSETYYDWSNVKEIKVYLDDELVTTMDSYGDGYFDDPKGNDLARFIPEPEYVDGLYYYEPVYDSQWHDDPEDNSCRWDYNWISDFNPQDSIYCIYTDDSVVYRLYSETKKKVYLDRNKESLINVYHTPYIEYRPSGKGVIYRMIDEYNNDCPYDFKNMQFLHDGEWHYTFSFEGTDLSLSDLCVSNFISRNTTSNWSTDTTVNYTYKLPMVTFNAKRNTSGKVIGLSNNRLGICVRKGFISAARLSGFIWEDIGFDAGNEIRNIYINISNSCLYNYISGTAWEFIVGSPTTPVDSFTANIIRSSKKYLGGNFVCSVNSFIGNTVIAEESSSLTISGGNITSCQITNTYSEGASSDVIDFGANVILRDCEIKIYDSLTINYPNTTSSSTPLRFLNIDARGWSETTITIPSDFPANSPYELKVAKNSKGEIKMWCDADLAN